MTDLTDFSSIFDGLTDEQREVASQGDGAFIVSAAAGSGKTHTVVRRAAALVAAGVAPEKIVFLTFSRAACNELQERLDAQVEGVVASTTHSLAARLIRDHMPSKARRVQGAMKDADRRWALAYAQLALRPGQSGKGRPSLYSDALGLQWNLGAPPMDGTGAVISSKRLRIMVSRWKTEGATAEWAWAHYSGRRDEHPVAYYAAAAYNLYEHLLAAPKRVGGFFPGSDFDDWLNWGLRCAGKKVVKDAFAGCHIIVDEAQDLNRVQYELISKLSAKASSVMLVGDDRQAIYGFRGARPDLFCKRAKSRKWERLSLSTNFRSGSAIVEAGSAVIANNESQLGGDVLAHGPNGRGLVSVERHEGYLEAARAAVEAVEKGGEGEHGIIVRNNAEAGGFVVACAEKGLRFRCKSDPFASQTVKSVLSWLVLASGIGDTDRAARDAHKAPGFLLCKQFSAHLSDRAGKGEALNHLLADRPVYATWRDRSTAEYVKAIRSLRADVEGKSASEAVERVLDLKGPKGTVLDHLTSLIDVEDLSTKLGAEATSEDIKAAALAQIAIVVAVARCHDSLASMVEYVEEVRKDAESGSMEDAEGAVLIGTAHSWKGLEREHVSVLMTGGVFPPPSSLMSRDSSDDEYITPQGIEDERRLAYVAVTRGKRSVTILAPSENYRGGLVDEDSEFIAELGLEAE
jgi:DNA helicase-2/ATP-dependent DNA helicase PcrA